MKPSFALNFTDDSIQLLHRTGKGWVPVGETPFDNPDLEDALSYMRKTAMGLEPGGFTTKLVIPNSQIRYTEVDAAGPEDDARRAQILAVLEKTTPLRGDEIAFDWSGKGRTVKVAALDRTTLAEAEGFATLHRFNPVSFVAIPDYGDFSGEPFFGQTEAAASLLAGDEVERDKNPLRILLRDLPVAEPVAAEPPAEPIAPAAKIAAEPAPAPVEEVAEPVEAPAELVAAAVSETALEPAPVEAPAVAEAPAEPVPELGVEAVEVVAVPAEPALAEIADEAPFTHVAENPAFPEEELDLPGPAVTATAALAVDDDLPPAPSAAAMVAFSSRRSVDGAGKAPSLGAVSRPDASTLARAARGKPVEDLPPMPRPPQAAARAAPGGLRSGMSKGISALVTAPSLGSKSKTKAKPAAAVTSATGPSEAAKSLVRPGGTFGNRPPAPPKSRTVLFLSLVAVLLLCLALIAAWSSLFLARGEQPADPVAVASVETAGEADALPAIEDEMLADGEDPEAMEVDVATADPEASAAVSGADEAAEVIAALPEVAAPAEPAPGIAADDPAAQTLPQQQDEIFLATADSPPPALDALSLPAPETATDALPGPQMPPPPFGTVYAFDAQGLLVPTPEGIVSPEGVMLIAGKPPRLPPSRSDAATAAAAAAALAPAPTGAEALVEAVPVATDPAVTEPVAQPDPDLVDRRPKTRPEGLAPNPDDAALAAEPAVEFVSLRPRKRPETVLAAGQKAREETQAASLAVPPAETLPEASAAEIEAALAAATAAEAANPSVVAISRRPAARPKDFSRAVEAAVAAAIRAPEKPPEPEPEPEAKPEKVAKKEPKLKPEEEDEADEGEVASAPMPKVPTKTTVAKQATFKNAINLSKINLIGVYGTQSKRYALVRQANGRYKKVKVGDKIDGGKIEAITQSEVRYQKGGRLITLKMPKG